MAAHSSVLAWRILGTEEPGGVYGVAQSRTRLKRLSSSSSAREEPSGAGRRRVALMGQELAWWPAAGRGVWAGAGRHSPAGYSSSRLYQQENGNCGHFLTSWEVIEMRVWWKLTALLNNFALTQKGNRKGPSIFLCEFLSLLVGPFF